MTTIPSTQYALQLTGKKQLELNTAKPVREPGPHEVLVKVECVGLCYSDIKLLNDFGQHVRKSEITEGISQEELASVSGYVPGDKPTVPGHEVVCTVVAVGDQVKQHKIGERYIVQADLRNLLTNNANAAIGYNFEGGLQEYLALDERVITHGKQSYLIPAPHDVSASALALVEPWACVESSYISPERRTIKPGGRLLIVADVVPGREGEIGSQQRVDWSRLGLPIDPAGMPSEIIVKTPAEMDEIKGSYDDIVYMGAKKQEIEALDDKLARGGILNVVLCGQKIGEPVEIGIGRIHYKGTRIIGTAGYDPHAAYYTIPRTGELRPNDSVAIIGAEGPMGQMHVIRTLTSGIKGVSIVGTGHHNERLDALAKKASQQNADASSALTLINTHEKLLEGNFSYHLINAVSKPAVADAITHSAPGSIINIFAGIRAENEDKTINKHPLDLDRYIANKSYMFGTTGSSIDDMKVILEKVKSGQLDTNCCVDAVSGMKGAIDGIRSVDEKTMAGKIVVYPPLREMALKPLSQLEPAVAAKLQDGAWGKEAEQALLAQLTQEKPGGVLHRSLEERFHSGGDDDAVPPHP